MIQSLRLLAILGLGGFLMAQRAYAGLFTLPHFVDPGDFTIGLEPEVILTSGAGVGINLHYTHGLNDLLNASGFIGAGDGPRKFRVGGDLVFDFFPDVQGQPGIGVIAQGLYVLVPTPGRPAGSTDTTGQVELTATPYVHKSVPMKSAAGDEIEPFFGVPVGVSCNNSSCNTMITVSIGTLIRHSQHLRSVIEFGIAVNHSYTYLSGGVSYYY